MSPVNPTEGLRVLAQMIRDAADTAAPHPEALLALAQRADAVRASLADELRDAKADAWDECLDHISSHVGPDVVAAWGCKDVANPYRTEGTR